MREYYENLDNISDCLYLLQILPYKNNRHDFNSIKQSKLSKERKIGIVMKGRTCMGDSQESNATGLVSQTRKGR